MDSTGRGPELGWDKQQKQGGGGLGSINSKFWNTIPEAEGSDRAERGLMGRSCGRSCYQQPQKGELPITGGTDCQSRQRSAIALKLLGRREPHMGPAPGHLRWDPHWQWLDPEDPWPHMGTVVPSLSTERDLVERRSALCVHRHKLAPPVHLPSSGLCAAGRYILRDAQCSSNINVLYGPWDAFIMSTA